MAFQTIIKLGKFLKALEEDSKIYVFLPMATDVRDYLIVLVHPVYERSLFMILSKLKSMKRLRMLTPQPTPNIRLHLFMGPKYAVMYMHLKFFVKLIRPIVIDSKTKSVNLRLIFTSSAKSKERISGKNETFTCNTMSKKNI